jgi:hypothetical protein
VTQNTTSAMPALSTSAAACASDASLVPVAASHTLWQVSTCEVRGKATSHPMVAHRPRQGSPPLRAWAVPAHSLEDRPGSSPQPPPTKRLPRRASCTPAWHNQAHASHHAQGRHSRLLAAIANSVAQAQRSCKHESDYVAMPSSGVAAFSSRAPPPRKHGFAHKVDLHSQPHMPLE